MLFTTYFNLLSFNNRCFNKLVAIGSDNNNKSVIFNNIKCTNIQSAGNQRILISILVGSSETIRQISNFYSEDNLFFFLVSRIIGGNGNFDLIIFNYKLVLKTIRM